MQLARCGARSCQQGCLCSRLLRRPLAITEFVPAKKVSTTTVDPNACPHVPALSATRWKLASWQCPSFDSVACRPPTSTAPFAELLAQGTSECQAWCGRRGRKFLDPTGRLGLCLVAQAPFCRAQVRGGGGPVAGGGGVCAGGGRSGCVRGWKRGWAWRSARWWWGAQWWGLMHYK